MQLCPHFVNSQLLLIDKNPFFFSVEECVENVGDEVTDCTDNHSEVIAVHVSEEVETKGAEDNSRPSSVESNDSDYFR